MKIRFLPIILVLTVVFTIDAAAQRRGPTRPTKLPANASVKPREIGSSAVVMDETLSVLRVKPSLFAEAVQRMRRGRTVRILGVAEADGVKFYKVAAPPSDTGWVQADAVFGRFRAGDEERLARFVQASSGFDQVELAAAFLEMYPGSQFRPAILLLFGDILEETAVKLSRDAASRLDRREMAATSAPAHSYYLNFVSLDRYRKLGIQFVFDAASRAYHYNGQSWKDIVSKYPQSNEAAEARKRLDSLAVKMGTAPANNADGKR